jgi:hypothetical protein
MHGSTLAGHPNTRSYHAVDSCAVMQLHGLLIELHFVLVRVPLIIVSAGLEVNHAPRCVVRAPL